MNADLLNAGLMAAFAPKGSWKSGFFPGLIQKSGSVSGFSRGFGHGMEFAVKGQIPFLLLGMGMSLGMAPKGHALSQASRSLGSTVGSVVGGALGGMPGIMIGALAGDKIFGGAAEKIVQTVADIGSARGKLNMGGNFEDSQPAWTMRQAAVQSMATSNLNARRYLGQEAAMFHT